MKLADILFIILCVLITTGPIHATSISTSKIKAIKNDFVAEFSKRGSSTSKRRAYKNIIRDAESLLRTSPDADNRFEVLALVLDAQKQLIAIENTESTRKDLFDICAKLTKAPSAYAELRLESDLILMEKNMSEQQADIKTRKEALTALIERYKNTKGEARSLMLAFHIAPKLDAFTFQEFIRETLRERFGSSPEVIEFLRNNNAGGRIDVVFKGQFKTSEGNMVSFPYDTMGTTSLIVFWSQTTTNIQSRLNDIRVLQEKHPGQFTVFSMNLDDFPDGGKEQLMSYGLEWPALLLPGGRSHTAYTTYIKKDPEVVLVNLYGRALIETGIERIGRMMMIPASGSSNKITDVRHKPDSELTSFLDSLRFTAQVQSLLIGDFLVTEPGQQFDPGMPPELTSNKGAKPKRLDRSDNSLSTETLFAINGAFAPPPFRYRLPPEAAIKQYQEIDLLCQQATMQFANAPDLWLVRNRRIIALMGLWRHTVTESYMTEAVAEAKHVLTQDLPDEAKVVAEYCIAQNNLRTYEPTSYSHVAKFIDGFGGCDAPPSALAAATLLALCDDDRDLFYEHRNSLLDAETNNSSIQSVKTYLRDRRHRYRVFRATHGRNGFTRAERHAMYRDVSALDEPSDTNTLFKAELLNMDGNALTVPLDNLAKLTFLVFIEFPSTEADANNQSNLISNLIEESRYHKEHPTDVILAFLEDDKERISSMVKENEWECQIAIVPDGRRNPLVIQHGLLSADKIPNIFLLRSNGSIAWKTSGISWPIQGTSVITPVRYAIESNLTLCQMENAKAALDSGNLKEAVRLFSPAKTPDKYKNDFWATFRYYSRARAYNGLQQYEKALSDVNTALDAHKVWGWGKPLHCSLVAEMEHAKADFLDKLGRSTEATEERKKAKGPIYVKNIQPYGLYAGDLSDFRLSPHSGK